MHRFLFESAKYILIDQEDQGYCISTLKKAIFELILFEIFKSVEICAYMHKFLFEFAKYIDIDCSSLYVCIYTIKERLPTTCPSTTFDSYCFPTMIESSHRLPFILDIAARKSVLQKLS